MEKYPIDKMHLRQIYQVFRQKWPELSSLADTLLEQYPEQFENNESCYEFHFFDGRIHLKVLIGDATETLTTLLPRHQGAIDAWYLDGFAPSKNPDMWTDELFQAMARLSHANSTLATFTAAGFVRRGLTDAGFRLSKAPGFGKKRELLYGIKTRGS